MAKPTEKFNRKSEKSNKKVLDLANITKFLKFAHSKTMDLARKPTENLAPDLDRGLFGDIEGTDFGRKKWYLYTSLFRIISATENHGFFGGSVSNRHLKIQVFRGCPGMPNVAQRCPTNPRKRQPLGAGKHAAELG